MSSIPADQAFTSGFCSCNGKLHCHVDDAVPGFDGDHHRPVFDFTNGFHDSANAMATSVATGALKPKVAVLIAGALAIYASPSAPRSTA